MEISLPKICLNDLTRTVKVFPNGVEANFSVYDVLKMLEVALQTPVAIPEPVSAPVEAPAEVHVSEVLAAPKKRGRKPKAK